MLKKLTSLEELCGIGLCSFLQREMDFMDKSQNILAVLRALKFLCNEYICEVADNKLEVSLMFSTPVG